MDECRRRVYIVSRDRDKSEEHVAVRWMPTMCLFEQIHRVGMGAGGVERDGKDIGVPRILRRVYPGEHGGHQEYGHFSKRCWRTLMKEAGLVQKKEIDGEKRLENIYTPYSLRHFYTSMLIADNKDIKTIQERLGHVDAAMTLNVYGHLIKVHQALAKEEDTGILGRIFLKDANRGVIAQ